MNHSSFTTEETNDMGHRVQVLPLSEPLKESTTMPNFRKELVRRRHSIMEDSGRERLKKHRVEVAGRVWIPDKWGHEELLKVWIDCAKFDAYLSPSGLMSARAALIEEGRRANSSGLKIENSC